MQKIFLHIALTAAAIVGTGFLLEEAAKGNLGAWAQDLAKKVTSGYGSVNA